MMKQFLLILLAVYGYATHGQSSGDKGEIKVSALTAQFLVSTNFKNAVFINLVGTGIKYSRGNASISIGVFPTIRFYEDPHLDPAKPKKPFIAPGFSAGLLFQYKRFMIATPAYFKEDVWHYTVGVGMKIGGALK